VESNRFSNRLHEKVNLRIDLKKEEEAPTEFQEDNEPSPQRKPNPLRDSHNPFLTTMFKPTQAKTKNIDPLRDSKIV
jgi:hypothetical protein